MTSLTFNGNQAHIVGTNRVGKQNVTVVVDVTDSGYPGTNDLFSIALSNGYSDGGNPLSGDFSVH